MKILHALVGYLAVIYLPFHQFAFASPLVIDYDGYVNSTTQSNIDGALMEHFLGTIVETCHGQGVTTPNHGDSALMKPVSGDIIEARQIELVPIFLIIVGLVSGVMLSVAWLEDDDSVRCNDI